jgi:hypothetical protein
MSKRLTTEEFIQRARKVHGDRYDYNNVQYDTSLIKVSITCHRLDRDGKEHGDFLQRPNDHLVGHGCKKCQYDDIPITQKMTFDEFFQKANKIHNFKYTYSEKDFIDGSTKTKITCKDHGDFWQLPVGHLSGKGCSVCSYLTIASKLSIPIEKYLKRAKITHNNLYEYLEHTGTNCENIILTIKCKKHGIFKQNLRVHLSGCGCPKCHSYKGEDVIEKFLIENNIKYIKQHKFDNCKDKRCLLFDFYLPDYNLCIEYDGWFHYNYGRFTNIQKAKEKLKYIQRHDQIKNKYCKKNIISLLRIPYWEFKNVEIILKKRIKFYLTLIQFNVPINPIPPFGIIPYS